MSDNDRIGRKREELAKLILPVRGQSPSRTIEITLGEQTPIPSSLEGYGPGMDISDKELDETIQTAHKCQECGYKW